MSDSRDDVEQKMKSENDCGGELITMAGRFALKQFMAEKKREIIKRNGEAFGFE